MEKRRATGNRTPRFGHWTVAAIAALKNTTLHHIIVK